MYGSDAGQPMPSLYTKGLSPLCDCKGVHTCTLNCWKFLAIGSHEGAPHGRKSWIYPCTPNKIVAALMQHSMYNMTHTSAEGYIKYIHTYIIWMQYVHCIYKDFNRQSHTTQLNLPTIVGRMLSYDPMTFHLRGGYVCVHVHNLSLGPYLTTSIFILISSSLILT